MGRSVPRVILPLMRRNPLAVFCALLVTFVATIAMPTPTRRAIGSTSPHASPPAQAIATIDTIPPWCVYTDPACADSTNRRRPI